ncbi:transcription factor 2B, putative [Trichomonas vaginalis G3]|uniref:Transcription factor 2B, putative n=1 Tax=Trichomonas vaginalis (strain ATCC PRA-98 / G3) TaxID=412133 RepID=A2DCI3_TRIV3|nr:regulation of cilium movement involved in cell motility [Trichomonas vaginalis G3]EAY21920.1 transcription factor 2B, putative [Trichomonas vaginalis G3]KAI5487605.1 regulation of cilium movement involved in cell motility [Trichomonas vaginalis G3]|eukprot:XP_001582906.1 transcription factor 2B [Trichomonas vaginalis G3]
MDSTTEIEYKNILSSIGQKPLADWDVNVENGYIKRLTDQDIRTSVLEITGANAQRNWITMPREQNDKLGINLPIISLVVKYLEKFFYIDILVMDDTKTKRLFKISNTDMKAHVQQTFTKIPMKLVPGWNNVTFDIADFVRSAYGTNYVETLRITIYANCRIRRVYFSNKVLNEDDIPSQFRILPTQALDKTEVEPEQEPEAEK